MSKVKVLAACAVLLLMFLPGCGNGDYSFRATVLQTRDTSVLVEPQDGSDELKTADKIIVYLEDADLLGPDGTKIQLSDIKEGDEVQIYYEGPIAESYPAQIRGCYRLRLLD